MDFYSNSVKNVLEQFGTDKNNGLTTARLKKNYSKYGKNVLTKGKKKTFFARFFSAITEPMILILLFGFFIALGTSIGKALKTGGFDFSECGGILAAILLSVIITLVMEGSSEKAFEALNKIYDNITVKVIRDGQTIVVARQLLTVGDLVLLESGDKIVADGRLIESNSLSVDESALTGESQSTFKNANAILKSGIPLAERENCVYSGTFVKTGEGKMVVTAVGDSTEIGNIAGELKSKQETQAPLQQKLSKLGKVITIIGVIFAVLVFALSALRLFLLGEFNFSSVQELFIECIVLIVAAVPEGLPTIVAISLALNMIRLAKENALIKKMTAVETTGAISVICSDKTGTLTKNRMEVKSVCNGSGCFYKKTIDNTFLLENFALNSTAEISGGKNPMYKGSGTECALLVYFNQSVKQGYKKARASSTIVYREPFTSDKKYMITGVQNGQTTTFYIKGAPEKVLRFCKLSDEQKNSILLQIEKYQKQALRVICFAHKQDKNSTDLSEYIFDGYVLLADPVREEVFDAVKTCNKAGIKIKMLTGDNYATAFAIAKELKIATDQSQVISASEIENLTDAQAIELLKKITVVARSTPAIKLRIVRLLKKSGEVVAVTGDGINDAPAIKHADVGIAMGISGSEITKEASDVILLDDSFATVVKAVAFGRTVYKNLQRFILFQLSVNLSALLFITVCAIIGIETPFSTLQLLWINVIMDGPPALTLGLEGADEQLMKLKPVKKDKGIVNAKMLIRIVFNGVFIASVLFCQHVTNFLNVEMKERGAVTFTLFILFQLFNAFNSRELGKESILKSFNKNKIMLVTFALTFLIHVFMIQVAYPLFSVSPMSFSSWAKCLGVSSLIVIISEGYKLVFRILKKSKIFRNSVNKNFGQA